MRNKPLLLLVGLFCLLTSQINAQGPGCRGLLRMIGPLDLALNRQAPGLFLPIQQRQVPQFQNEGMAIILTTPPTHQTNRQLHANGFNLFQGLRGLLNTFFRPNILPQTQNIIAPQTTALNFPILTLGHDEDGVFRSDGSTFPPIGDGNGQFYFFPSSDEDDEDGEPVRILREPPVIYRAINDDEETLDESPEDSPLGESLEQLLRLIQFSQGYYIQGNYAAPPIIGALIEGGPNLHPAPPNLTLTEIIEDILQTWRTMSNEDSEPYLDIDSLIGILFNTLLTAFHEPAANLENPSLEQAQVFARMLTEGAEANPHNQPDPVILAHMIFELEALVRAQAIDFEQLQAILKLIENREEAAFVAFGQDFEEGVAINEAGNRRLADAATYAFLEARANLLLLHLVDPSRLQVNTANLQHNAHVFLGPILSGTTNPSSPAGIALERTARALLKAQYRFRTLCLAFWDSGLAEESIEWAQWNETSFVHGDLGKLLFLIDLYRAHQGLRPGTPSSNAQSS